MREERGRIRDKIGSSGKVTITYDRYMRRDVDYHNAIATKIENTKENRIRDIVDMS